MKKRILNILIVLAMLAALAGCGSGQEQNIVADHTSEELIAAQTTESDKAGNTIQEDETRTADADASPKTDDSVQPAESVSKEEPAAEESGTEEVKTKMLRMTIGNTAVTVDWENNESVEALKALCENEPLVIQMSMYGGFEQVGSIGSRLPSSDVQTTTSSGDIVLYSSSQIVVFYGSNLWAYTRLGHITDQNASGMADLLSNGNVTVTISMEDTE